MNPATTTRPRQIPTSTDARTRAVVVHSGARDAYQVAKALADEDILEKLVTDLFWPADRTWARWMKSRLPNAVRDLLAQRSQSGIPFSRVHLCASMGLATLLSTRLARVPQRIRRKITRRADAVLGRAAGQLAQRTGAGLLSYSYYGHAAFSHYQGAGILFQLHPHPASMRRILSAELEAHPECAASLQREWEIALPEEDFQRLVAETRMARHFLAASSFTRTTLMEHGVPGDSIRVIPYGVDSSRFIPGADRPRHAGKLRLLFVGQINQRKGIKYLLEALELLDTDQVELTVCGRVVDDLSIFKPFGGRVFIRPNVSAPELLAAYQQSDLFVFPSVAEGFGQVLLESLACGLPIVSTTRTAAPDLIEQGRQGFVVEPRRPDHLADRIEWALTHRRELTGMRDEARFLAEQFTWQRFRTGVAAAVRQMLLENTSTAASPEIECAEVGR